MCRTPACRSTRATSSPPVSSAIGPDCSARGSDRPVEVRQDVGRDGLDLRAGLVRVADRVEDEVVAAGVDELLECLAALRGRPDDAVTLGQRPEVLAVARRQPAHPRVPSRLEVASDRDEGEVGAREAVERPARAVRRRADLLEALAIARGGDHVGDPAITNAPGPGQCRVRAPTDPDRGTTWLDGLGVDADGVKAREAPLERGRGVPPEGAQHLDALVDPRAALPVRYAARLELLG